VAARVTDERPAFAKGLSQVVREVARAVETFHARAGAQALAQPGRQVDDGREACLAVTSHRREFLDGPAHKDGHQVVVGGVGEDGAALVRENVHFEAAIGHVAEVGEVPADEGRHGLIGRRVDGVRDAGVAAVGANGEARRDRLCVSCMHASDPLAVEQQSVD
jgi:hypothetical protein